jgi:hypothetical protein
MSESYNAKLKVFGSEETLVVKVKKGETFLDVLRRKELYPDDYIITDNGNPVPIDGMIERKEYVIYKVPSGG